MVCASLQVVLGAPSTPRIGALSSPRAAPHWTRQRPSSCFFQSFKRLVLVRLKSYTDHLVNQISSRLGASFGFMLGKFPRLHDQRDHKTRAQSRMAFSFLFFLLLPIISYYFLLFLLLCMPRLASAFGGNRKLHHWRKL